MNSQKLKRPQLKPGTSLQVIGKHIIFEVYLSLRVRHFFLNLQSVRIST